MEVVSEAFDENTMIPEKYTADGDNVNPPLKIVGMPKNAKSGVLIIVDPDAPRGDFVHWVLFNIPPGISEIAENSVPEIAIQGRNSRLTNYYIGPAPPSGTHRYFFKFYALDTELNLDDDATKTDVDEAMKGHIIDSAELVGLYYR